MHAQPPAAVLNGAGDAQQTKIRRRQSSHRSSGSGRSIKVNSTSQLLAPNENDLLHRLIGPDCVSQASAVVRVFKALPSDPRVWTKVGSGVATFVKDSSKRSFFIRVYDLASRHMIFEEEIYNQFTYAAPTWYLHTFYGEACTCGLNFADEEESQLFKAVILNRIEMRERKRQQKRMNNNNNNQPKTIQSDVKDVYSQPPSTPSVFMPTPMTPTVVDASGNGSRKSSVVSVTSQKNSLFSKKNDKKSKKFSITKDDIGDPTNFVHVQHVGGPSRSFVGGGGYTDKNEQSRQILQQYLISNNFLQSQDLQNPEWQNVLDDFISTRGGPDELLTKLAHIQNSSPDLNSSHDSMSGATAARNQPLPIRPQSPAYSQRGSFSGQESISSASGRAGNEPLSNGSAQMQSPAPPARSQTVASRTPTRERATLSSAFPTPSQHFNGSNPTLYSNSSSESSISSAIPPKKGKAAPPPPVPRSSRPEASSRVSSDRVLPNPPSIDPSIPQALSRPGSRAAISAPFAASSLQSSSSFSNSNGYQMGSARSPPVQRNDNRPEYGAQRTSSERVPHRKVSAPKSPSVPPPPPPASQKPTAPVAPAVEAPRVAPPPPPPASRQTCGPPAPAPPPPPPVPSVQALHDLTSSRPSETDSSESTRSKPKNPSLTTKPKPDDLLSAIRESSASKLKPVAERKVEPAPTKPDDVTSNLLGEIRNFDKSSVLKKVQPPEPQKQSAKSNMDDLQGIFGDLVRTVAAQRHILNPEDNSSEEEEEDFDDDDWE